MFSGRTSDLLLTLRRVFVTLPNQYLWIDVDPGKVGELLEIYGQLPSYRAMLDREGAAGPADIALVGDEAALRARIAELRDVGVTDFDAALIPVDDGAVARTREFLVAVAEEGA